MAMQESQQRALIDKVFRKGCGDRNCAETKEE